MAHVTLDADGNVTGIFAVPQPHLSGYAEIDDTDPKVAAFQAAIAAAAARAQKLASGLEIASAALPTISGTYAIDPSAQQKIAAISLYIAVNGRFPAGQATLAYPDLAGAAHVFPTTAIFQAFATALADYVAAIDLAAAGTGEMPSQPVTIA